MEALIDVGKKNISNDGIDVVYGESVSDAIGNTVDKVSDFATKYTGLQGISNVGNKVGGALSKWGKILSGDEPIPVNKKNLSKKAKLGKQIADSTKNE